MQNSNKGKRIYPSIFQPIKKSHAKSRIRTCAGKSQMAFISNALTITTLHKLKVKRALHSPWTRMLHMYNLKHFVSVLQMVRALAPFPLTLIKSHHFTRMYPCENLLEKLDETNPTPLRSLSFSPRDPHSNILLWRPWIMANLFRIQVVKILEYYALVRPCRPFHEILGTLVLKIWWDSSPHFNVNISDIASDNVSTTYYHIFCFGTNSCQISYGCYVRFRKNATQDM